MDVPPLARFLQNIVNTIINKPKIVLPQSTITTRPVINQKIHYLVLKNKRHNLTNQFREGYMICTSKQCNWCNSRNCKIYTKELSQETQY